MNMAPREQRALYLGAFAIVVPGLIMAGFMPAFNVLPAFGWILMAMIGSGGAGAIATPRRWLQGTLSGAVIGGGALLGILLYVELRSSLIQTPFFLRLEIAIGAILGAIPGSILFMRWAKSS
jgi:hypothetical protein